MEPSFPILSNAHARNAYGMAAQSIVCSALGLRAIPIDGSCETCFDAERRNIFYEIKSVHRNGKIVVYKWRIEKELAVGVPVFYAILVHEVRGARSSDAMFKAFRKSRLEILLVPVQVIHHFTTNETLRQIKANDKSPRSGYNRTGYKDGYYNLSLAPIRRMCVAQTIHPKRFQLYGVGMKATTLNCDVTCLNTLTSPSSPVVAGLSRTTTNPTFSPQETATASVTSLS